MDMGLELTPSVMTYYVPRYDLELIIISIIVVVTFFLRLYFIKKKNDNIKVKRIFAIFYILILISMIIMICIIPWGLNFGERDMVSQSVLTLTNNRLIIIICIIALLIITEMIMNARSKKKEKVS